MDLSWLLPESVRGTNSQWETQRGPSVPPAGTSWHPQHLHGVGGGHPWDNRVPQVAVTQKQDGNQEMMGTTTEGTCGSPRPMGKAQRTQG